MQIPHSYCDVSALYQTGPAPQTSETAVWNKDEIFGRFLDAVRKEREEDEDEAIEDALEDVIDSMNQSEEEQRRSKSQSMTMLQSLQEASQAISKKFKGKVDPMQFPEVQAIMYCLRDCAFFGPIDQAREEEQERTEKEQDVTEERDLNDPDDIERR